MLLDRAAGLGRNVLEQYRRGTALGTFVIELPARATVRALALAGFDFAVLDLEHSPFGVEPLSALISEAHLLGMPVIVRPPSHDVGLITKILDIEARMIVAAARYSPRGERGLSPLIGMADLPRPQIARDADILVIAQIEGRQALPRAAKSLPSPG